MHAELDTEDGKPVLKLSLGNRRGNGRYSCTTLPITAEQANKIRIFEGAY